MKSVCACVILLITLYANVEAQNCRADEVGSCIEKINEAHEFLRFGAVGLIYNETKMNTICTFYPEARRCYNDVLKPCEYRANTITKDVLKKGKVIMNERGNISELCGNPKYLEKYGEMVECFDKHHAEIRESCLKKAGVELGFINERQAHSDVYDALKGKPAGDKLKNDCCLYQKKYSCMYDGVKDKCGETMAEFFKEFSPLYISEGKEKCTPHMLFLTCSSLGINLTAGISMIFVAFVSLILAK